MPLLKTVLKDLSNEVQTGDVTVFAYYLKIMNLFYNLF